MAGLLQWTGLTLILGLAGLWTSESANITFIGQILLCVGTGIMIYQYIKKR